jgi:hypothetical protein
VPRFVIRIYLNVSARIRALELPRRRRGCRKREDSDDPRQMIAEKLWSFCSRCDATCVRGESIGSMTIALFVSLLQASIRHVSRFPCVPSVPLSLLISLYLPFRSGYFRSRAIHVDLMPFLDDVIDLFQSCLPDR